jgi:hypothetical protein
MNVDGKVRVATYLSRYGVTSPERVEEIISGFDLEKPVYEQLLNVGDVLQQYIRKPDYLGGKDVGNWFSLSSATMSGLAIFGGGSGRHPHRFRVAHPFSALEGTALPIQQDWRWAGGGPGGQTQIYVPPRLIGHLESLGPL